MAVAGHAKERKPNSPSAQRQAESSTAWGSDLGRVVTVEVICPEMTAGRGEVLLRIWTASPPGVQRVVPRRRRGLDNCFERLNGT
jgi:hypothetical protein